MVLRFGDIFKHFLLKISDRGGQRVSSRKAKVVSHVVHLNTNMYVHTDLMTSIGIADYKISFSY